MGYIKKSIEIEDLNREIGLLRTVSGHLNDLRELDRRERQELEGRLMDARSDLTYRLNKEIQKDAEIEKLRDENEFLKIAVEGKAYVDPQITPKDMTIMEKDINSGGAARNGINVKDGMLEISTGVYGEMDVNMRFALISAKIFHPGG